jgi:hypothetical protein
MPRNAAVNGDWRVFGIACAQCGCTRWQQQQQAAAAAARQGCEEIK